MSKWLVVGPNSFTGSNFIRALHARGEVVDTHSLRKDEGFVFRAYDYIVNFAAVNVVAPSWDHPAYYAQVNIEKQIRFLEKIRQYKFKKYVHISTPEVYGAVKGIVCEDHPHNPSTPYAASRSAAEAFIKCYAKQYDIPIAITRGCNVYGPGQQLYRLIPKLMWHVQKKCKFPLEGGGNSSRSFLYVDDMCSAIRLIAREGYGDYHITSSQNLTIRSLVKQIIDMYGPFEWDAYVQETADRPGKDPDYSLSNGRLNQLGWKPKISLDEGLINTNTWLCNNWGKLKDQDTECHL